MSFFSNFSYQKRLTQRAVWAHSRPSKCTKTVGGRGFAPDPTGGAYSAPPDPLAGFGEGAPRSGAGGWGGDGMGKGGEGLPPRTIYTPSNKFLDISLNW
jgi:hypothetical protein